MAVPEADPTILHIDPANTLLQTGTGLAIFVPVRAFRPVRCSPVLIHAASAE